MIQKRAKGKLTFKRVLDQPRLSILVAMLEGRASCSKSGIPAFFLSERAKSSAAKASASSPESSSSEDSSSPFGANHEILTGVWVKELQIWENDNSAATCACQAFFWFWRFSFLSFGMSFGMGIPGRVGLQRRFRGNAVSRNTLHRNWGLLRQRQHGPTRNKAGGFHELGKVLAVGHLLQVQPSVDLEFVGSPWDRIQLLHLSHPSIARKSYSFTRLGVEVLMMTSWELDRTTSFANKALTLTLDASLSPIEYFVGLVFVSPAMGGDASSKLFKLATTFHVLGSDLGPGCILGSLFLERYIGGNVTLSDPSGPKTDPQTTWKTAKSSSCYLPMRRNQQI